MSHKRRSSAWLQGYVSEDEAGRRLAAVISSPDYSESGAYWSWSNDSEAFVNTPSDEVMVRRLLCSVLAASAFVYRCACVWAEAWSAFELCQMLCASALLHSSAANCYTCVAYLRMRRMRSHAAAGS